MNRRDMLKATAAAVVAGPAIVTTPVATTEALNIPGVWESVGLSVMVTGIWETRADGKRVLARLHDVEVVAAPA